MRELSPQARMQLDHIKRVVAGQLTSIERQLPPGYKLTLIARHPTIPNAQMVVTDDNDLEAVANELLSAKSHE